MNLPDTAVLSTSNYQTFLDNQEPPDNQESPDNQEPLSIVLRRYHKKGKVFIILSAKKVKALGCCTTSFDYIATGIVALIKAIASAGQREFNLRYFFSDKKSPFYSVYSRFPEGLVIAIVVYSTLADFDLMLYTRGYATFDMVQAFRQYVADSVKSDRSDDPSSAGESVFNTGPRKLLRGFVLFCFVVFVLQ